MVLYVNKYDILPEKAEQYAAWAGTAITRVLAVPGVLELRGYRPATGSHQVVVTYEFQDMAAWASWADNDEVQKVFSEARTYTINYTAELWGPSPIVTDPIRPGQS